MISKVLTYKMEIMEKKNDGTEVQGKERFITPSNGWVALFLTLVGLIGGAALKAPDFAAIVKAASK